MAIEQLNDPIPYGLWLADREIDVKPVPRGSELPQADQIEQGLLNPKILALHHFFGISYPTPYVLDSACTVNRSAPISEQLVERADALVPYALKRPRPGENFSGAQRRETPRAGALVYVMFHPARNEVFDIVETTKIIGDDDDVEYMRNYARHIAALAIPDAQRMSDILGLPVDEQKKAEKELHRHQRQRISDGLFAKIRPTS